MEAHEMLVVGMTGYELAVAVAAVENFLEDEELGCQPLGGPLAPEDVLTVQNFLDRLIMAGEFVVLDEISAATMDDFQ